VSKFVEECRHEWRRLGVPDAVANEMAADLEADLTEAEAEGESAEDVLGNAVFDSRSFAASWAAERGVIGPAPTAQRFPRRSRMFVAFAAPAVLATIGAAIVIFSSSPGVERQALARPVAFRILPAPPPPTAKGKALPRLRVWKVPFGRAEVFVGRSDNGARTAGIVLLIAGLVGLLGSLLYWSPRPRGFAGP
jgi:hypothetical protein